MENKYLLNIVKITGSEIIKNKINSYLLKNLDYKINKLNIFNFIKNYLLKLHSENLDLSIDPYLKKSIEFINFSKKYKPVDLIKECKIALNLEMRNSEIGDFTNIKINKENIHSHNSELFKQYFINTLILLIDFYRSPIQYKNIDNILQSLNTLMLLEINFLDKKNFNRIINIVFN